MNVVVAAGYRGDNVGTIGNEHDFGFPNQNSIFQSHFHHLLLLYLQLLNIENDNCKMLRKEQHGQKRGSCYHLDTFSQLTKIFLDRASGAGYYTCLVFGAGMWRQQVHRKRRYLNIIQGDSFGTRPKKMRISQRLFIRF